MIKLLKENLLIDSPRWGEKIKGCQNIGWAVKFAGEEYADFVTVTDPNNPLVIEECREILERQMIQTMKLLLKRIVFAEFSSNGKTTKQRWQDFAMSDYLQLADDCGIKVLSK